jgi:hypothetical protein
MHDNTNQYLERALDYDQKAERADSPTLKHTYRELARSYRTLAAYVVKASGQT